MIKKNEGITNSETGTAGRNGCREDGCSRACGRDAGLYHLTGAGNPLTIFL